MQGGIVLGVWGVGCAPLRRSGLENQQIQLRKAFWDTEIEDDVLLEDPVALNLCYVEAREAIRARVIEVPDAEKAELKALTGDKRGFLERCQGLKGSAAPSPGTVTTGPSTNRARVTSPSYSLSSRCCSCSSTASSHPLSGRRAIRL